ncbi:MAG: PcfJ domain-containing protein, partial [Clostridiales bacterium]|nr:PcfJ domain-containing protein [Clostridiales bacterium]
MKYKTLEKLEWEAGISARIHEDTLVLDICGESNIGGQLCPLARICVTENEYASLEPETGKWDRKNIISFLSHNKIKLDNIPVLPGTEDTVNLFSKKFPENNYHSDNWWYRYCYGMDDMRPILGKIDNLEAQVSQKRYDKREEKRRLDIDARMKTVPALPKGFKPWAIRKVVQHQVTILPYMGRKITKGICSSCGAESEFSAVKPKDMIRCPHCGKKAVVRRFDYETKTERTKIRAEHVLLFQRTSEGFVQRFFTACQQVSIGSEKTWCVEDARVFFVNMKEYTYYHILSNYTGKTFWDDRNLVGMFGMQLKTGPVYPGTFKPGLFADTGFEHSAMELLANEPAFEPIRYLEIYSVIPQVEMAVKFGLTRLVAESHMHDFHPEETTPWGLLGLSKEFFYHLRDMNGGKLALVWLKHCQDNNIRYTNQVAEAVKRLSENRIWPNDMSFMKQMSLPKIFHYMEKQAKLAKRNIADIPGTWADYLSMAKRLGYPVDEELFFKPKNLVEAHNRMVRECDHKQSALRAAEVIEMYPDVDRICAAVKEKYSYSGKTYAVVMPERVEEIVEEGKKLGHCLGSCDRYFARIQSRESYIGFLRKTDDPDQPYYTLEIEPDGTVRQLRTFGDKQDAKETAQARVFLKKWQHVVQARLASEDRQYAQTSRILREENFVELRENKTKVWHGPQAGQLLADIL